MYTSSHRISKRIKGRGREKTGTIFQIIGEIKKEMDNKHIIVPDPERRRCENYVHFKGK